MNSDDLGSFLRIAEAMSLSAASRSSGTPKSSLSRTLSRLEGEIGAKLFERGPQVLRLTEAGRILLTHARRVMDELNEASAALDGVTGQPRGILKVSAATTFAIGLVAPMLPRFLQDYPDLRIHLDAENRIVDLPKEDIDVAIRIGVMSDSDLIASKLGGIELWPCASPSYLSERGTPRTPYELADHELLGWTDHPSIWCFRDSSACDHCVSVAVGSVIPEPAVLQVILENGGGIGRLPDFLARSLVEQGRLVRLLPDFQTETVEVHAVYAAHRSLSSKVRVFIDALRVHLTR
ncbi:LysR substrate-binding domain-containing protein [Asaia lannensis]|uniref:LysR substrate-binding domain-containing protein n=1 Tax=Asaia lannensis NBRC 102526 TaxID=1307926 RepID=A0ABT1CJA1_9PROT|nr:LysR family transcriptional regulator [Asaia lannensis]MCO6160946.1 LysR substrate-binding domain-containing protein [Asaia lannensis NBRC 102526]GBR02429.1 LysR family transcriptional regulator [Asaia lannensis NBRC 102526]